MPASACTPAQAGTTTPPTAPTWPTPGCFPSCSPIDPRVESAENVCDRVLEAAEVLPVDRLGTNDDCGFSLFADDTSTSRDVAFAKITVRVEGSRLAAEQLGR